MAPRLAVASICIVFSIPIACGGKVLEDPSSSPDVVPPSPRPAPIPSTSSTATKSAPVEPRAPGTGGSYPYCEAIHPDGWTTYCPSTIGGHGYFIWHTDRDGPRWCEGDVEGKVMTDCNTCQCRVGCTADAACPAPPSGTSNPECVGLTSAQSTGTCILPCGDGQTCPDGMTCVSSPENKWWSCAWVR